MNKRLQALVVDDETAIRRLTMRALKECEFDCDEAVDGDQALSLIWQRKYDVVVTDLKMPKRHGHSLAVELFSLGQERPLIVVLTGVIEPKLASDLIARGVDDIQFKPVDFRLFGAKVRAMCVRRRELKADGMAAVVAQPAVSAANASEPTAVAAACQEIQSETEVTSTTDSEQILNKDFKVGQSDPPGWITKIVATLCPPKHV